MGGPKTRGENGVIRGQSKSLSRGTTWGGEERHDNVVKGVPVRPRHALHSLEANNKNLMNDYHH